MHNLMNILLLINPLSTLDMQGLGLVWVHWLPCSPSWTLATIHAYHFCHWTEDKKWLCPYGSFWLSGQCLLPNRVWWLHSLLFPLQGHVLFSQNRGNLIPISDLYCSVTFDWNRPMGKKFTVITPGWRNKRQEQESNPRKLWKNLQFIYLQSSSNV